MKLECLLGEDAAVDPRHAGVSVTGLTADSREVGAGSLFAALSGTRADGVLFVPDAIAAGAVAVLVQDNAEVSVPEGIALVRAVDPRRVLARAAARLYSRQPATQVAVTGTSGKTSVADFTRQIFTALGHRAASLGTIGIVRPDGEVYGGLTTPDPVALHRSLDELAGEGVTHLAFEASSHGLDQRRLDGVRLAAAAFTNLGHDHLDYHPSVEAYLAAKLRLFEALLPARAPAVIDADGDASARVVAAAQARGLDVWTTGRAGKALRLVNSRPDGFHQRLTIAHGGETFEINLGLIGGYQASNALVAAGLAIATGEPAEAVLASLAGLRGVRGRLEVVARPRGGIVVIDYAHKPDALEAVLAALRPFASGRLAVVFGCGGDRDREKRPIMGRIAVEKADVVIVADDNPRREDASSVRADILAGAPGAREIGDRREAIRVAVGEVGPGDVLVVAGKGHETGQIVGDVTHPFSDHEAVAEVLAGERESGNG